MKNIIKTKHLSRLWLVILTAALCLCAAIFVNSKLKAHADGAISYVSKSWDAVKKEVVSSQKTCSTYEVLTDSKTSWSDGKWYVVNSNLTISGDVYTYGTVNLIICDGCTLSTRTINANSNKTLNIYGQSLGTGTLNITSGYDFTPGIYNSGSNLNIHGCNINTKSKTAAGIGGRDSFAGGTLTIYGGNINASSTNGAGIGGGYNQSGGTITIYGGNINATSANGAGIGGGQNGAGANLSIFGGVVRASSTVGAVGIGAGAGNSDNGTLTVLDGAKVYGGDVENPGTEIIKDELDNYARHEYMLVKTGDDKIEPVYTVPEAVAGAANQKLSDVTFQDDHWHFAEPNSLVGDGIGKEIVYISDNPDVYQEIHKTIDVIVNDYVTYISKEWNGKEVVDTEVTTANYFTITDTTLEMHNYTYVLKSDVTINTRVNATGIVNIILSDNCTLTLVKGLTVSSPNTLNIYSQGDGENEGKIIAELTSSDYYYAAIGGGLYFNPGEGDSGTINIFGGNITASTCIRNSLSGAGIGGSANSNSDPINIYGGTINATGGYMSPGIGGGYKGYGGYKDINIGPITIYGGNITSTGGEGGPGIGGPGHTSSTTSKPYYAGVLTVEDITIYGGNINAYGGAVNTSYSGGPGIGFGYTGCTTHSGEPNVDNVTRAGKIIINGGTINAYGGNRSAGIGTGTILGDISVEAIIINGGTITATAYTYDGSKGGAGIGSGYGDIDYNYTSKIIISKIEINGGNVTATGDAGPGIGLPIHGTDSRIENMIFNGGVVTAIGDDDYDGIGCTSTSDSKYRGTITLGNVSMGVIGNATGTPADTDLINDYATNRPKYMIIKSFHEHSWSYEANEGTLTATCQNDSCYITDGLTLTMVAPSELIYDSTAKVVTLQAGYNEEAFPNPVIKYYKDNVEVTECINAGVYIAKVTFEDAIATLTFEIIKADSVLSSAPTSILNLEYTGNEQELVNSGTASGGTIQYKIGLDGTYDDNIPVALNAGNYNIYYKVVGDSNHNDVDEAGPIQVSIAKINPSYIIPTGVEASYGDKLKDVELPEGWSWKNETTEVGNVGSREHTAIFTPADTVNYNEIEETVEISVQKGTPTYTKPTNLEATFGNTLKDIELPNNWTWKEEDNLVGNAGIQEHIAIFTPTDTVNYNEIEVTLTISVLKANPIYTKPTNLEATYGDVLSTVELPEKWTWKDSKEKVGNAGIREHTAIYTPTDVNNYNVVEDTLNISIAKANPTYTVPTDIEAPYDVKLSKVALPEGFSWMNGEQVVNQWGDNTYKAKFIPFDTSNYNVVENININVNVKWILIDPTQGDVSVTINNGDTQFDVNIKVQIEVKTEISTEEKQKDYRKLGKEYINPNEDIAAIYDVKLIRTINGVEEEIQPSDITPGTTIFVQMAIPEELVGKEFRLLHIHTDSDISEISNYSVSKDGKTLTVEINKLSEFVFVGASQTEDNGFIYKHSLPVWAIILIIVGSILVLFSICYVLVFFVFNKWINIDDKQVRVFRLGQNNGKVRVILMNIKFEYLDESLVFNTKEQAKNNLLKVEE